MSKIFNRLDLRRAHSTVSVGARALLDGTFRREQRPETKYEPPKNHVDGKPPAALGTRERLEQDKKAEQLARFELLVAKKGFRDFKDFLYAVQRAGTPGVTTATSDPRLIVNAAPPGNVGGESTGESGGFAVPAEFALEILGKTIATDSLLMQTDVRTVKTNKLTIPKDENALWDTAAGIQTFWEREGAQKDVSKPILGELNLSLNKLIALVPLTDELVEDSDLMVQHVSAKAPEKMAAAVEAAIINGSGIGQPLGIANAPGTIVVAPEAGQAAGTIVAANVRKMWKSLEPSARKNATWLIHGDVEEQIQQLVTAGSAGDVAAAAPLYGGPSTFAPYGTLLGRPLFPSQGSSALGLKGDIVVGDLSAYVMAMKTMRRDISIHLWFDFDITAFRFVLRIGGQPFGTKPIPDRNGNTSRAYFSTLATRA